MDFDVVIVGSGLVGASFAAALGDSGLRLALVEASSPPPLPDDAGWDSRIYAISPGSAAFLEQCGAWQQVDATRVTRVEDMRVFGDDGVSRLEFSAYDAGLRELAFIVESRLLQHALGQQLQRQPQVRKFCPATCAALAIGTDAAELTLGDGTVLRARLVVAADGGDSWVRTQAGIGVTGRPYRQTGVVANFDAAKPHRGIAFQWFMRDGVLALLPLPGNRVSMVWSCNDSFAMQLLEMPPDALAAAVTAASGATLGNLALVAPAAGFPLRLQRAKELVKPRLALIGDAAHNVHPLAGQGVNLGFRDARELARVVRERGAQGDCGDYYLLRRYERARREDILALQLTTDMLQQLFNNAGGGLARLRNFGLRLTNRQAQLKNLLVQRAVG